jgi:3,4-dihydroxy 2-butanone 4-phosphate synthase / GTP cyclohydrolase II
MADFGYWDAVAFLEETSLFPAAANGAIGLEMDKTRKGPAKRQFSSVESVIEDIRLGRMVIITDNEERENEGDLVMAAEKVTAEAINFMTIHGRGLICVPTARERLLDLGIAPMVTSNQESHRTAFMVSVDAREGITTGISAHDRARTIWIMADPRSLPRDLVQPGHVFPLQAKSGGVLERAGHTEAAVDLARLGGLSPSGVICEILNPDGTMARFEQLLKFAQKHKLKICSIEELIAYRRVREKLVEKIEEVEFPTPYGKFKLHAYRSLIDGRIHLALVHGKISPQRAELVRVHAENVASDVFDSSMFKTDGILERSMRAIAEAGAGVLLYIRHDGWGPVTMPEEQVRESRLKGRPATHHLSRNLRSYGVGAQILVDLGLKKIKLLTNQPKTVVGLEGFGIRIVEQVPLPPAKKSK